MYNEATGECTTQRLSAHLVALTHQYPSDKLLTKKFYQYAIVEQSLLDANLKYVKTYTIQCAKVLKMKRLLLKITQTVKVLARISKPARGNWRADARYSSVGVAIGRRSGCHDVFLVARVAMIEHPCLTQSSPRSPVYISPHCTVLSIHFLNARSIY